MKTLKVTVITTKINIWECFNLLLTSCSYVRIKESLSLVKSNMNVRDTFTLVIDLEDCELSAYGCLYEISKHGTIDSINAH